MREPTAPFSTTAFKHRRIARIFGLVLVSSRALARRTCACSIGPLREPLMRFVARAFSW